MADPILLTNLTLPQAKSIEQARMLQLVAESKLDMKTSQDKVVEVLQQGNSFKNEQTGETFGKLQMTRRDAETIATTYTLLDRQDTSSGLTVMYLKNNDTQQVVRVAASTQYAEAHNGGDAARDIATDRQILNVGYPANQLADLERAELAFREANPAYADVPFQAVGFSLSATLQLGLEKLHPEWTAPTGNVLFNASGTGTLPEGVTLRQFVDLHQQALNAPASVDMNVIGATFGFGSDAYNKLSGLRDAAVAANAERPVSSYAPNEDSVNTAQTQFADAFAQITTGSQGRGVTATVDSAIPTDKYLVAYNHGKGMDAEIVMGGQLPATRVEIPVASMPMATQLGPIPKLFGNDSNGSDIGFSHSIMPTGDTMKLFIAMSEISPSMNWNDFVNIVNSATGSVAAPYSTGLGDVWDGSAIPLTIKAVGKLVGVDIDVPANSTLAGLNSAQVSTWNEQGIAQLKAAYAAKQAENPELQDLGITYRGNNPQELARLALEDSDAGIAARYTMANNLPLVASVNLLSAAEKAAYALDARPEGDWQAIATSYGETMDANRIGQGSYSPLPNTPLSGNGATGETDATHTEIPENPGTLPG